MLSLQITSYKKTTSFVNKKQEKPKINYKKLLTQKKKWDKLGLSCNGNNENQLKTKKEKRK